MKVSVSTISVFMHTEREKSHCEGQCLACDAALFEKYLEYNYLFS